MSIYARAADNKQAVGGYLIREIYEKNKTRLLVIARSYLGDRAEDAVYDAFVKLIEKYEGTFQELWEMPSSYFVAVVKNRSIDGPGWGCYFYRKNATIARENSSFCQN